MKTEVEQELTLLTVLNNLHNNQGFVDALLGNFNSYYQAIATKISADASLLSQQDRTKMHLLNQKHSH